VTDSTPRRVVLVGTGTSVGKTWTGVALLREFRRLGLRAVGLKPIESGVDGEGPTDGGLLASESYRKPDPAPYCFVPPLSPHLAARLENRTIELEKILTYVWSHESSPAIEPRPDVVVIETAGGLFSPLSAALTNWDLARALDPARWVLVAADALGVLHDSTATLLAAAARGRRPDLVALSAARSADASTGTNADELERLGIAGRVFRCKRDDESGVRALAEALHTGVR